MDPRYLNWYTLKICNFYWIWDLTVWIRPRFRKMLKKDTNQKAPNSQNFLKSIKLSTCLLVEGFHFKFESKKYQASFKFAFGIFVFGIFVFECFFIQNFFDDLIKFFSLDNKTMAEHFVQNVANVTGYIGDRALLWGATRGKKYIMSNSRYLLKHFWARKFHYLLYLVSKLVQHLFNILYSSVNFFRV